MKPNSPVPVIQPMVVATALANATNVKIVPWIRRSHRRNLAIPDVDCEVVKVVGFIRIDPLALEAQHLGLHDAFDGGNLAQ